MFSQGENTAKEEGEGKMCYGKKTLSHYIYTR